MTAPTIEAGNRALAMGSPVAKDFFDPHMRTTVRSSLGIPIFPGTNHVRASIVASRATDRAMRTRTVYAVTPAHAPSAVALTTAENTMRMIEELSIFFTVERRARNQSPTNG